jgi:lycopene cyclase domain-containing protein
MNYYYLLALILALVALMVVDRRYKLVLFRDRRLATCCLLAGLLFFLIWDIAGLTAGVFSTNRDWVSGLYAVTPNLPLEEFIFLLFLGYVTLISWELVCSRTS